MSVVLENGKKLSADGSAPHSYKLTKSRVSDTGLVVANCERADEVKTADVALDKPGDKERARQEHMKREDAVSNAPGEQRLLSRWVGSRRARRGQANTVIQPPSVIRPVGSSDPLSKTMPLSAARNRVTTVWQYQVARQVRHQLAPPFAKW